MDAFEKRKQRELNRKYNKQVSAMKKAEKARDFKDEIKSTGKYKSNEDEDDDRSKGRPGRDGSKKPEKSFRRQAMVLHISSLCSFL